MFGTANKPPINTLVYVRLPDEQACPPRGLAFRMARVPAAGEMLHLKYDCGAPDYYVVHRVVWVCGGYNFADDTEHFTTPTLLLRSASKGEREMMQA